MKKQFVFKLLAGGMLIASSFSTPGYATSESLAEAASKAKAKFDLSESDTIYSSETDKALYYQNLQIIGLLEEIRDEIKILRKQKDEKLENGGVVL